MGAAAGAWAARVRQHCGGYQQPADVGLPAGAWAAARGQGPAAVPMCDAAMLALELKAGVALVSRRGATFSAAVKPESLE